MLPSDAQKSLSRMRIMGAQGLMGKFNGVGSMLTRWERWARFRRRRGYGSTARFATLRGKQDLLTALTGCSSGSPVVESLNASA